MADSQKISVIPCLILMAGLFAGCIGKNLIIASPSWHQLKSGMYDMAEGKVFYGIGQASGVRNLTLLRATADNHARKELEMVMDRYLSELARSAKVAQAPAWTALSPAEQQWLLGALTRKTLQQAVVSDHWSDPRQSRLSALCRLDLAEFKFVLSDTTVLSESLGAAMGAEAENVYNRLAQKF